jgi:high-affinity nickel-transport protein
VRSLTARERRTLAAMVSAVAGLHVLGFAALLAFAAPAIGVGVTAYALGLRHAFDADHIAAIDNTTRRLMSEGRRPLTVGFWFSLGHSTVVFAVALLVSLGVRSLDGRSTLRQATGSIGVAVSGSFLYLIAAINLVILVGIAKVFREMRTGRYDEAALERRLDSRGPMSGVFGRVAGAVATPRRMYPVGVLFGLGFDTASEVALLVIAGLAGAPWYAVLCLPILFAAGMTLLDSIDGSFMTIAYGWALSRPVRKVFYNLTITCLSAGVALMIGTIEIWFGGVDLDLVGLALVALFVVTWAIALLVWRVGRIEERWSAHLE